MIRSTTVLWLLAGLLFAALSGVAVYRVWPLLNPQAALVAPLDESCDLRAGPCMGTFPNGARVSLSITPRSIPVVQPLRLQVAVAGVSATAVQVDFQGVDMNMGFNRRTLAATGDGRFAGDGMLPVCVRDAMEWEVKVLVESDDGLLAAPFRFMTVKPGMAAPDG